MDGELTNRALGGVDFLIGEWDMALSCTSFLPAPGDVVHGRIECQPVESGALLVIRQFVEASGTPAAVWLVGRDEARPDYTVLYADARGVSRVYQMSLSNDRWRMWRDDPVFSQRFEATVRVDEREIVGHWERCGAGGTWEHDFNVTYSRL
jgi:hypothetical protein